MSSRKELEMISIGHETVLERVVASAVCFTHVFFDRTQGKEMH